MSALISPMHVNMKQIVNCEIEWIVRITSIQKIKFFCCFTCKATAGPGVIFS